jgi:hypothetical protein
MDRAALEQIAKFVPSGTAGTLLLPRRKRRKSCRAATRFAALAIFLLSSCLNIVSCDFFAPRDINRIRTTSFLRAVVKPEGYNYNDEGIATAIVQQLPIGASWGQIQEFVAENFIGVPCTVVASAPHGALLQLHQPQVFIRAIEIANSSGGETVEIYLFLWHEDQLEKIVVKSTRSYM